MRRGEGVDVDVGVDDEANTAEELTVKGSRWP